MSDKQPELFSLVTDFIVGLKRKAKVDHAGNCLVMSEILKEYLYLFGIETKIINVSVSLPDKKINHYCLKMNDGNIIDATASQFSWLPEVYIGQMPANFHESKS